MGDFKEESEVEITDENGKLIADPEDRKQFRTAGRYLRPLIRKRLFRGEYNPLSNNCIHFTRHYIFEQLLFRLVGLKNRASIIQWIVKKWHEVGHKRSPRELSKHLAKIFGVTNPFRHPNKGPKGCVNHDLWIISL